MGALLVKEAKVSLKPLPQICDAVVGVQVDMLALHRAPESFNKEVVHPPSLAIHADLDVVGIQDASELLAGELSALVGVKDLRPSVFCNSLFQRPGSKKNFRKNYINSAEPFVFVRRCDHVEQR